MSNDISRSTEAVSDRAAFDAVPDDLARKALGAFYHYKAFARHDNDDLNAMRAAVAAVSAPSSPVLAVIVEQVQWAVRQIDHALDDSRCDDFTAAVLRTIRRTLTDSSGEMDAIRAASMELSS